MISILMSSYKSNFDYLKAQIDSIVNQTEKDWELLIWNDGTDGLHQWLLENYPEEPIIYYDGIHLGYAKAYNYLLHFADGEYVCFCDHDDIWRWDKLEIEKKYLDEHPDVDCVFSWLNWFGEQEKLESFHITDEDISKELYFYQPIKQATTMFRKDRFGEFDCPFDVCADFWFWAKHKDRHYHLLECFLVNYRRHSGEMTKNKALFRENHAKVIQKSFQDRCPNLVFPLDICKKLDPFSKTYNKELKDFLRKLL